ncbi:hypothetical protein [Paraburkholderia tropica]|uniref:hypothetical protein n=1 Tax=Paraburkholderia tropica TaxID=92647 RepID=UPI002AB66B4D|nr:hypothetical protein [Paraburkholderia tropica]
MSNHQAEHGLNALREEPIRRTRAAHNDVNRYRQMHSHPVATLVRSTDERPEIADAVVLGYN